MKTFVVINKEKHLSICREDIVAHGIEKNKVEGKNCYKGWFDMVNGRTYHTGLFNDLKKCEEEVKKIIG